MHTPISKSAQLGRMGASPVWRLTDPSLAWAHARTLPFRPRLTPSPAVISLLSCRGLPPSMGRIHAPSVSGRVGGHNLDARWRRGGAGSTPPSASASSDPSPSPADGQAPSSSAPPPPPPLPPPSAAAAAAVDKAAITEHMDKAAVLINDMLEEVMRELFAEEVRIHCTGCSAREGKPHQWCWGGEASSGVLLSALAVNATLAECRPPRTSTRRAARP